MQSLVLLFLRQERRFPIVSQALLSFCGLNEFKYIINTHPIRNIAILPFRSDIASKIAAEKGFGNMAVSNAFGSNTFNIMVGLGLPWLMYTSFGTGFEPYSGLRNEGRTFDIIAVPSLYSLVLF